MILLLVFLEFVASESDEDDKEKVLKEVAESFLEKGSCIINLNKVNTKKIVQVTSKFLVFRYRKHPNTRLSLILYVMDEVVKLH